MKQFKRFLSFFLAVVMILSMLPLSALAEVVDLTAPQTQHKVNVDSFAELKEALESELNIAITLTGNIYYRIAPIEVEGQNSSEEPYYPKDLVLSGNSSDYHQPFYYPKNGEITDFEYEDPQIHVVGEKTLDLNGYDITVEDNSNVYFVDNSVGCPPGYVYVSGAESYTCQENCERTLINVENGAKLMINDATTNPGTIHYDAYMHTTTEGDRSVPYYQNVAVRDIIKVAGGELIVNGGIFEAGRSKKQYISGGVLTPKYWSGKEITTADDTYWNDDAYQQIWGSAIRGEDDAKIIINGGTFYGRGEGVWNNPVDDEYDVDAYGGSGRYDLRRDAVIDGKPNTTLIVNNGTFYGKGGANIFYFDYSEEENHDKDDSGANLDLRAGLFYLEKLNYVRQPDMVLDNDPVDIVLKGTNGSMNIDIQFIKDVYTDAQFRYSIDGEVYATTVFPEDGYFGTTMSISPYNKGISNPIYVDHGVKYKESTASTVYFNSGYGNAPKLTVKHEPYFANNDLIPGYEITYNWKISGTVDGKSVQEIYTQKVDPAKAEASIRLSDHIDYDADSKANLTVSCMVYEGAPGLRPRIVDYTTKSVNLIQTDIPVSKTLLPEGKLTFDVIYPTEGDPISDTWVPTLQIHPSVSEVKELYGELGVKLDSYTVTYLTKGGEWITLTSTTSDTFDLENLDYQFNDVKVEMTLYSPDCGYITFSDTVKVVNMLGVKPISFEGKGEWGADGKTFYPIGNSITLYHRYGDGYLPENDENSFNNYGWYRRAGYNSSTDTYSYTKVATSYNYTVTSSGTCYFGVEMSDGSVVCGRPVTISFGANSAEFSIKNGTSGNVILNATGAEQNKSFTVSAQNAGGTFKWKIIDGPEGWRNSSIRTGYATKSGENIEFTDFIKNNDYVGVIPGTYTIQAYRFVSGELVASSNTIEFRVHRKSSEFSIYVNGVEVKDGYVQCVPGTFYSFDVNPSNGADEPVIQRSEWSLTTDLGSNVARIANNGIGNAVFTPINPGRVTVSVNVYNNGQFIGSKTILVDVPVTKIEINEGEIQTGTKWSDILTVSSDAPYTVSFGDLKVSKNYLPDITFDVALKEGYVFPMKVDEDYLDSWQVVPSDVSITFKKDGGATASIYKTNIYGAVPKGGPNATDKYGVTVDQEATVRVRFPFVYDTEGTYLNNVEVSVAKPQAYTEYTTVDWNYTGLSVVNPADLFTVVSSVAEVDEDANKDNDVSNDNAEYLDEGDDFYKELYRLDITLVIPSTESVYLDENVAVTMNGVPLLLDNSIDYLGSRYVKAYYYFYPTYEAQTVNHIELEGILPPSADCYPATAEDVSITASTGELYGPLGLSVEAMVWYVDLNENGIFDAGEDSSEFFEGSFGAFKKDVAYSLYVKIGDGGSGYYNFDEETTISMYSGENIRTMRGTNGEGNFTFDPAGDPIKLYIAGKPIYDGYYYEPGAQSASPVRPESGKYAYYEDGVLYLENFNLNGDFVPATIVSNVPKLSIELYGENKISSSKDGVCLWMENTDLTIEDGGSNYGLELDAEYVGIYVENGNLSCGKISINAVNDCIVVNNGDVNIYCGVYGNKRLELNSESGRGISVTNGNLNYEYGETNITSAKTAIEVQGGNFVQNGGTITAQSNGFGISADTITINEGSDFDFKSYYKTLDEENWALNANTITFDKTILVTASTDPDATELGAYDSAKNNTYDRVVAKYRSIDVLIGGVGLRDGDYLANGATETQATKPNGGYAYYTFGKLVLHDFELTNYVPADDDYYSDYLLFIGSQVEAPTVMLEGKNTLSTAKKFICGIYANDLTIRGDGSLDVNTAGGEAGIEARKLTLLDGCDVRIKLTDKSSWYGAVYVSRVTVTGSKLTVIGDDIECDNFTMSEGAEVYFADAGRGLNVDCDISISDSTLTTENTGYGIYADEEISVINSTVNIKNASNYGICGGWWSDSVIEDSVVNVQAVTGLRNVIITGDSKVNVVAEKYAAENITVDGGSVMLKTLGKDKGYSATPLGIDSYEGNVYYYDNLDVGDGLTAYAFTSLNSAPVTYNYKEADKYAMLYVTADDLKVTVGNVDMTPGTYLANGATETQTTKPDGGYAYFNGFKLTLNDFELVGSGSTTNDGYTTALINAEINDIQIELKGTNTLISANAVPEAIYGIYGDNITISGDGSLDIDTNSFGIIADDDVTVESGEITIKAGQDGISAAGDLTINGGDLTINADFDGIYASGDLTINGGDFTINTDSDGIHASGDLTINGGDLTINTGSDGIYAAGDLTINGGYFDITAGCCGVAAGSDVVINNPDKGQFIIRDATNGIYADGNIEIADCYNLIIENVEHGIEAYNSIIIKDGKITIDASEYGICGSKPVKIQGGNIKIDNALCGIFGSEENGMAGVIIDDCVVRVNANEYGIFGSECEVIINNASVYAEGGRYAICGDYGVTVKGSSKVSATSNDLFEGECYAIYAGTNGESFKLQGKFNVTASAEPGDSTETYDSANHTNYDYILVEVPEYDLMVGGIPMEDGDYLDEYGNILTTAPEDNYAYYSGGVLTLQNYDYRGNGYLITTLPYENNYAGIYSKYDLTINVQGTNSITALSSDDSYGIVCDGYSLNIEGDGDLIITVNEGYGIYSNYDIAIDSTVLSISSSNTGINAEGTLTVKGANIAINSDADGIYAWSSADFTNTVIATTATDCGIITGSLYFTDCEVMANGCDNGIWAEGDIYFTNTEVNVTAQTNGIISTTSFNDYSVYVNGGKITVVAGSAIVAYEGLNAVNANLNLEATTGIGIESEAGGVILEDCELLITSAKDGISTCSYSEYDVYILDSKVQINAGDYGIYGSGGAVKLENSDITVDADEVGISGYDSYNYTADVLIDGGNTVINAGTTGIEAYNCGLNVLGGNVTIKSLDTENDDSYSAIGTSNEPIFAAGLEVKVSTETDGELGEYVAEDLYTYDYVVITDDNAPPADGYTISGNISGLDGDATVWVYLYKVGGTTPIASVMVEGNGSYLFEGVKPGDYVLEAVTYGYYDYSVNLTITDNFTHNIEMSKPASSYSVIFTYEDGSPIFGYSVNEGDLITEPASPAIEGKNFLGWYVGGVKYNFSTPVTSDITLVAKFETIAATPVYSVTYIVDSTIYHTENVEQGNLATKPTDPAKESKNFLGWYLGETKYDFSTPITGNILLVAKFEDKAATVLKGDVNLDGVVDMEDTTKLMRHVLNAEVITDANALAAAEVTGNTSVDMEDVTKLMRYVLNAIDSLD